MQGKQVLAKEMCGEISPTRASGSLCDRSSGQTSVLQKTKDAIPEIGRGRPFLIWVIGQNSRVLYVAQPAKNDPSDSADLAD